MRWRAWAWVASVLAVAACQAVPESAKTHGEFLYFACAGRPCLSCADCHGRYPDNFARNFLPGNGFLTGASLRGVQVRKTFWGGAETDLLRSINLCRRWFMGASHDWTAKDGDARAMWAFVTTLASDSTPSVPFTVVASVQDIANGDAASGRQVFGFACQNCHGALHTGAGPLQATFSYVLPELFVANHAGYSPVDRRLTFIEKVRHGPFLGYGGSMPPFSKEVLSDGQIGDLLAAMGL